MRISEAIKFCLEYQKGTSRINTIKNYEFVLGKFENAFHGRELESIKTEEVISFLVELTYGRVNKHRGQVYTSDK